MMSYWTNFAKTGDPNGPGLPAWPRYGKDDLLIHLDSTITSGLDTERPRYEFLLKACRRSGSEQEMFFRHDRSDFQQKPI